MSVQSLLIHGIESVVFLYVLVYATSSILLILYGFNAVRHRVRGLGFEDLDMMEHGDASIPGVAVVMAAYNEERTIIDSVRALTELDYPQLEIVVVNDGSTDHTKEWLRRAFSMQRRDLAIRHDIRTAPVRGIYEARIPLPSNVLRLILVDKENGGRADASNAGINACVSPLFLSVDADSILDSRALKQIVRIFQEDPDIVAAGGQIGIINACTVRNGKVVSNAIPRQLLPLCQTVEYLRSFSILRTGFSRLNSLVILSGAFMVLTRKTVVEVGGFLTGRNEHRLLSEYVGPGRGTVCEDMEVIVRIHRYLRERGLPGRVVHSPTPLCWTEVPDSLSSLGKQRRRWHRGLLEILRFNRRMLFNRDYGRIGLFAMPYFLLFEMLGPYVELLGWLLLPVLGLLGVLDPGRVLLVMAVAVGGGVLHSLVAVLCSTWLEPTSPTGRRMRSMVGADRWRDRLLLMAGCFLAELGFRQLTLLWRLHGTWDFLRGRKGWDKFARTGFKEATATAALLLMLLAGGPAWGQTDPIREGEGPQRREILLVAGQESQEGEHAGWWMELTGHWHQASHGKRWAGLFQQDRLGFVDRGMLAGWSGRPLERGGVGSELRLAPHATLLPRVSLTAEGEMAVGDWNSASLYLRGSRYRDLTVLDLAPGSVFYLPRGIWISLRGHVFLTWFDAGTTDRQPGWGVIGSVPWRSMELRLMAGEGSESYLSGAAQEAREIRALSYGLELRHGLGGVWELRAGASRRQPDLGRDNLYLQLGLLRVL